MIHHVVLNFRPFSFECEKGCFMIILGQNKCSKTVLSKSRHLVTLGMKKNITSMLLKC